MSAIAEMQLATFNTLALRFQDDAFTLAYYLLGSDTQAAQATEMAFTHLYRCPGLRHDQFRLEVLHEVLANSRVLSETFQVGQPVDSLSAQLQRLDFEERSAVVLVDVLDLSYEESGWVMKSSRKQIVRLLAQARIALSRAESRMLSPALL